MFSLLAGAGAQTAAEREGLSGKVKSVCETVSKTADHAGRPAESEIRSTRLSRYDSKGYLTEESHFSHDKRLTKRIIFAGDSGRYSREERTYGTRGQLSRQVTFGRDDGGYRLEEKTYNSRGRLSRQVTYTRDGDGYRREEKTYRPAGRLSRQVTYIKDSDGPRLEEKAYNTAGDLTKSQTRGYDSSENPENTDRYDLPGITIGKRFYKTGNSPANRNADGHNPRGNPPPETAHKPDSIPGEKITFRYDSLGNWTEKIILHGETPAGGIITRRIIEYYDRDEETM